MEENIMMKNAMWIIELLIALCLLVVSCIFLRTLKKVRKSNNYFSCRMQLFVEKIVLTILALLHFIVCYLRGEKYIIVNVIVLLLWIISLLLEVCTLLLKVFVKVRNKKRS